MQNNSAHFDKKLLALESSIFLSTYRRINWNEVIVSLLEKEGSAVTTDPSRWNTDTTGYNEIYAMWKNANFNSDSIKWINYYPRVHFDQSLVDDIADYLNVNVHRAWISRIDPGYFAPKHWDVDDNENEYLLKGDISRYSILMGDPTHGHIFILGDDYLFNCPKGSIFKWNNHRDWHSGINAGMVPKFMFHLIAYNK